MKLRELFVLTREVKLWIAIAMSLWLSLDTTNPFKLVVFISIVGFAFPFPEWVEVAPFRDENGKMRKSLILPTRGSPEAAGLDLHYAGDEDVVIPPHGRVRLETGFSFGIPFGYVGLVRDRSGRASRYGVMVGAGVIDSDFTGELEVLLFNTTGEDVIIKTRDGIAQILFVPCIHTEPMVVEVSNLRKTQRGSGGFGSTAS